MPWYQYQYPAEDPYYNQYQYPKMKTDTDSKLDTYTNTYNQKLLYYNFFPRLWDNFKNEEDLENKIIFKNKKYLKNKWKEEWRLFGCCGISWIAVK